MVYLHISKPTLLRYKHEGMLHPVPLGSGDRYAIEELDLLPYIIVKGGPGK